VNNNGAGRGPAVSWMYVGFVLTGMGTALLGCILPTLIATWHLDDGRAGGLLAAQFAGAALGAGLVTHDYFNSIVRGYALLIASALSLAWFNASPHSGLFLCFGLGLGLTMTATSMLAGRLYPGKRGAVLSSLNACWCLGAVLCPGMVSLWVGRWPVAALFLAFGFAVAMLLLVARNVTPALATGETAVSAKDQGGSPLLLIAAFAFVGFLYVGVEASVSSWMMVYVRRLAAAHDVLAPVAVSGFWIALLCGRAIAPAILRRISEQQLLNISLPGAFIAVLFLIIDRSPLASIFAAIASGLLLGPIYPLCLAKILALTNDSPRTKWVFGICGLGAALLPWLTGKVSTHHASLSVGLLVPLAALALMVLVQLLAIHRSSHTGAGRLAIR
jgi:FHS family glucose/mannose:H+ symporter-like MFS transporter